ncbi:MAG: DUF1800 domain-containing protein [Saprospiraceae bacterium]|nr:DUF1800 domain-containing protein [Saprospiraceae bacterium]
MIQTKHTTSLALPAYQGPWTTSEVAHLLRRTLFGPTPDQIMEAVHAGPEATVDRLLADRPLPDPPLHYKNHDPDVPVGTTWVDAPYREDIHVKQMADRNRSLYAWNMALYLEDTLSIREKMVLFWHNHFAIRAIEDPKYLYRYNATIRAQATGNFATLIKQMTVDPALLIFLNGNRNRREAPNENYARELLELYTVGKGPQTGPGDYTNYTEADVGAIARALTGWHDEGFLTETGGAQVQARFSSDHHDPGDKQLSPRLQSRLVSNREDTEYLELLDILLEQEATATHLCSKLYRWLVDDRVDEVMLREVIRPLGALLRHEGYELKPVLRNILLSAHFYRADYRGTIIKNPLDLVASTVNPFQDGEPLASDQRYDRWYRINELVRTLQMDPYEVPQVAGWDAYYRAPLYNRHWINAATLPVRMATIQTYLDEGFPAFEGNGPRIRPACAKWIIRHDHPGEAVALTTSLTQWLLPVPLAGDEILELSKSLAPVNFSGSWQDLILAYQEDPHASGLEVEVDACMKRLIKRIFFHPSFQLS